MTDINHLKTRSDLHIARKIWHMTGVLLILVIYHNVSHTSALQLITLATTIFVAIDITRQQWPAVNKVTLTVFYPIMRESERNSIAGTTFLLTGTTIVMFFFPRDIVKLSLLFLAVADPVASYFGVLYGKDKLIGSKSLQGSVAAFISCTALSAAFYMSGNLMTDRILLVSLLSGLVGAAAELVPVGKLDDNFTLPVISSVLLWVVFFLFGGF